MAFSLLSGGCAYAYPSVRQFANTNKCELKNLGVPVLYQPWKKNPDIFSYGEIDLRAGYFLGIYSSDRDLCDPPKYSYFINKTNSRIEILDLNCVAINQIFSPYNAYFGVIPKGEHLEYSRAIRA